MNLLTVSEKDDGASQQTMLHLKAICAAQIKKKGYVFLWASTPCTGGCPYQRLRARDPVYRGLPPGTLGAALEALEGLC